MNIHATYLGYWYQRTTLHLSEVFDFLTLATSPLNLNRQKLSKLQKSLDVLEMSMRIGVFEYIDIHSKYNINIRVYEDGLVIFEKPFYKNGVVEKDIFQLKQYFENKFAPAMSYIFSLGAPVPKELANIKTISPFFIATDKASSEDVEGLFKKLQVKKYYEIPSSSVQLYRGGNVFLLNVQKKFKYTRELVEMQIFFREFKVQLHRYLNMHRVIWERIADVKERGEIRGKEVGDLRNQLESYKKTIELVDGRIQQMGMHMSSREHIIKQYNFDTFLSDVLEFKYETLNATLSYIKSLWSMTVKYVDTAINLFSDIETSSTKDSVRALTAITTVGVIAGIVRLLTVDTLPEITQSGLLYFGLTLIVALIADKFVRMYYRARKYKIKNIEFDKDID